LNFAEKSTEWGSDLGELPFIQMVLAKVPYLLRKKKDHKSFLLGNQFLA
jgi:hypothetical protein